MSDSEEPSQGKELFRTPSKAKKDLTASIKPPSSIKEIGGAGSSKESGSSGVGLGATSGSGMSNTAVVPDARADRDDANPEDAVGMRKALKADGD